MWRPLWLGKQVDSGRSHSNSDPFSLPQAVGGVVDTVRRKSAVVRPLSPRWVWGDLLPPHCMDQHPGRLLRFKPPSA